MDIFKKSIKYRLLALCTVLVTVPTLAMGYVSYSSLTTEFQKKAEDELSAHAKNWEHITTSYAQQLDRVIKREDVLAGQKLKSISQDVSRMFDVGYKSQKALLFKQVSDITIGKSGYVAVLDGKGKYLISKEGKRDKEDISKSRDGNGNFFILKILEEARRAGQGESVEAVYMWKEADDSHERSMLTVTTYNENFDVYIIASSYITDFRSDELKKTLQDELKNKISEQRIGENGNMWAIDTSGNFIVSKNRLRDGENILEEKAEDGRLFFKETIDRGKTLKKDETAVMHYTWKNLGDARPEDKVASFAYNPEWEWIIGATAYKKDYQEALKQIQLYIAGISIFALLIGVVTAYYFAYLLTKPISELTLAAAEIGQGDLNKKVEIDSEDEIGQLGISFNDMVSRVNLSNQQLQEKNDQIASKVLEVEKQNKVLEDTKKAMVNLLADQKELDAELKQEKEGVEIKVKERTKQLKDEQARLEASINSLGAGFIMTDNDCQILNINSMASAVFCQVKHETDVNKASGLVNMACSLEDIEKNVGSFFDLRGNIKKCLESKKSNIFKEVLINERFYHIFISPIIESAEADKPVGVLGTVILIEDETEEKILQRSRDEFFSIASHELRTPLTAIKGNTAMIRDMYADKLDDPDLKQMVDDIHDASSRLITIVNDFLNVSRLEQGKMEFKKVSFEISAFIKSVIKDIESLAQEKKISLTYLEPNVALPSVYADSDRLKEVLFNLVGNAIKFTEKGGVTVQAVSDGKNVKVLVTDTGKGMPAANQGLLFKKFQQASNNILTRDSTRSTGLGLYIAKLIMEGMGGTIGLEKSEENIGSTFAFTVPIGTAPTAAPASVTPVPTAPVVASPEAKPAIKIVATKPGIPTVVNPKITKPDLKTETSKG